VPATGPHLLDASAFWGPAGGVRRVITARHAALEGLGWRHSVLAPGARGNGFLDCGGLPLPASGGYRFPVGRHALADRMASLQPDLIEVADPYVLAWAALEAGQRLGVPAVAFCHSNLPAMAARLLGGRHGLGTRRGLWAARRAQAYLADLYSGFDLVLAPSRCMVRRLQQWGLRRVQQQPLGVDCTTFSPALADAGVRRQIAQRLGVPPGTRLLVYSGRFAPEKNLDVLAEAVDLLGSGHVLVAVGSGPRPPRGRRVRVLPTMTEPHRLARLLANADLYLHAGDQETFGLGALEAMACGLPTVLSAADGLGELAAAGGMAVSGRRPRDWADAAIDALTMDLDPLRALALDHARRHDWQRVVLQMVQRYDWVLQQDAQHRTASRTVLPSQPGAMDATGPLAPGLRGSRVASHR
jgi:alpha-1,6-mannosyltransferase